MANAPLILGIPAAAHREALLRPTAGGGRVPTTPGEHAWQAGPRIGRYCDRCGWVVEDPATAPPCVPSALILHHPTDPEAGAMGLARLAWVAAEGPARWEPCQWALGWRVWLHAAKPRIFGSTEYSHDEVHRGLTQATSGAHAIGLVCVHLGLLEAAPEVP